MKAEETRHVWFLNVLKNRRAVWAERGLLAKVPVGLGRRREKKKREESTCLQHGGLERRTAHGLAQHSPICEAQTQGITQAPQAKTNRFKRWPCLQLLYQHGQQESLLRIFSDSENSPKTIFSFSPIFVERAHICCN